MIKPFTLLFFFAALFLITKAQEKSFVNVSLNKGIGFNYHRVYYYYNSDGSLHKMPFSAGGGLGVQVDYSKYTNSAIAVTAGIGYQQILAAPYEESREDILASFNYTNFSLGLNLDVLKTEKIIEKVSIGSGLLFAIPGKLRRREEDIKQAPIKYNNSYGWQVNSRFLFDFFESRSSKLNASLGYKHLSFSDLSKNTPANLEKLNGNGLFLTFGVQIFL